jgi:hypothetical protein
MERIPEPELMEDEEQVLAYGNADFTASNELFVNYILQHSGNRFRRALDLGCGPGIWILNLPMPLRRYKFWPLMALNR